MCGRTKASLALVLVIAAGCQQAKTAPAPAPLSPPPPQPAMPAPAKATPPAPIRDSAMTVKEAMGKNRFPASALDQMMLVEITYWGFDERPHQGQLVISRELASDVKTIFAESYAARFPIEKMIPIVRYGWDDDKSVADNNTSGFNYRRTPGGSALSQHSFGRAIDINPWQNPYLNSRGRGVSPYRPGVKGTITAQSSITKIFKRHGWRWGGDWARNKDYQHFYKP